MKNKITKPFFLWVVLAIGYTNLHAQNDINVVDHKGTKKSINKVTSAVAAPTNTVPAKPVKGDIYRQLETAGGDVKISYVYNGTSWVPMTSPAAAAVTGTEGSVFFADTAANGGAPTENNDNFFWDNTNKRLGIGNKAPQAPLDVTGTAIINSTYVSSSNITVGLKNTVNKNTLIDFNSDSGVSGREARIARYAGIDSDFNFRNWGTGKMRFLNNGLDRLTILSDGNVGIGTTSPSEKLEVNGKVKIKSLESLGSIETNKIVVVGADGVLKKTTPFKEGDIKFSTHIKDHDGWYIANGRSITVTVNGANRTVQLPDLRNKFLKMKGAPKSSGGVTGNKVTLTKSNLPDYELPKGLAEEAGKHSHKIRTQTINVVSSVSNGGVGARQDRVIAVTFIDNKALSAGAHTHDVKIRSGGSGKSFSIENEYVSMYAFYFIDLNKI